MARKMRDVTNAELAILEVLWDRGEATIRQLTDVRYPTGTLSDYATVKKLLGRLEAKGYVGRDRRSAAHVFAARVDRDQLVGLRLQALAENLCGGSRVPLLMHLLQTTRLTREERRELDSLLDELAQERRKRSRS